MTPGGEHTDPRATNNKTCTEKKRKHWLEYAIFVFVVATTIATLGAAYYTRQQWLTAIDSEQRQTRAYVFLKDIKLERRNDGAFDIIPEFENTGNSETVNMRSHMSRHLSDVPLPNDFNFGDIPVASEVPIILGPRTISNIAFDAINKSCLDQFNRRDEVSKFYIWGRVNYNDTLTEESHITRFCWDVNQVIFSADGTSARISHVLCESGNCADHDCPTPEKQIVQLRQAPCKATPNGSHDASPAP